MCPDAKAHSNVHFTPIARCCLLQTLAYLVVTARQRHLRMLRISRLPGVRRLMHRPEDLGLKAGWVVRLTQAQWKRLKAQIEINDFLKLPYKTFNESHLRDTGKHALIRKERVLALLKSSWNNNTPACSPLCWRCHVESPLLINLVRTERGAFVTPALAC